jgi:hypothetical protein
VSNPVNLSDLEARFRSFSPEEEDGAQALSDDAWEELLARVPNLEQRLTAGTVSTGLVVRVVSAMVVRVLRNPDSIKTWSVDDASFGRDSLVSSGLLFATDDEIALLSGRASSARRTAFSVAPGVESCRAPGSEAEFIDYLRYGRRW